MSAWAKPGVKCVCVKKGPWRGVRNEKVAPGPTYLEECHIEAIQERLWGVELKLRGHEKWYLVDRFRPLITQADDVALFAHLLTGTPVRELVEC